jgi:hypothetical protein
MLEPKSHAAKVDSARFAGTAERFFLCENEIVSIFSAHSDVPLCVEESPEMFCEKLN